MKEGRKETERECVKGSWNAGGLDRVSCAVSVLSICVRSWEGGREEGRKGRKIGGCVVMCVRMCCGWRSMNNQLYIFQLRFRSVFELLAFVWLRKFVFVCDVGYTSHRLFGD